MEGSHHFKAEPFEWRKKTVVREAVLAYLMELGEQFRNQTGISLRDFMREDAFAAGVYDHVAQRLEAQGLESDSLELIELIMEITEGQSPEGPNDNPDEGGSGVREPRKPYPTGGIGHISLPPELGPTQTNL